MSNVKNAVISSFLGKTKDRFHEYNEEKTLEEKFKMIADMEGVDGAEVVFPYEAVSYTHLTLPTTPYV